MKLFIKSAALLVTLTAIFGFTLTSCSPEPESGPGVEGIHGGVEIYNMHGEKQDPSGVTVTLEQTGKTIKTDSKGEFVLPRLETGTYTLIFTKDGQPTTYVRNVEHTRTQNTSTLAPIAKMIEPSSFHITQAAVAVNRDNNQNPYFAITGKLNKPVPTGKEVKVKLYLSSDASVSLATYVHQFTYKVTSQDFVINYPYFASLSMNGAMKRGDTVFMVMFTDAIEEDKCDGPYTKPICLNSSTMNTSNPVVFREVMP